MSYLLGEISEDDDFVELVEVIRRPRARQNFRIRPNNFEKWNNTEFRERFRLDKPAVQYLINKISPAIASQTDKNQALSPQQMVLVTLRYLATGSMLKLLGDSDGINIATVSRAIGKVLPAIASLRSEFITMPSTVDEMKMVMQGFFTISRFPRCIGAIDCTHVKISSPGGDDAENYRNRKNFFSINTQVVCDSKLRIQNIVCRWPGSAYDSTIFRQSRLKQQFESNLYGNGLMVGDAGYALTNYLITPLRATANRAENLFNEAQVRTRNPIERCFGILKRRFPVLALGIRLNLQKVQALIVACAVLHNIALIFKDDADFVVSAELEVALAATVMPVQQNNEHGNGSTRHILIHEYFASTL